MLASRLGLVPLKGNKDGLRAMGWYQKGNPPTDKDTAVLNLRVACERNPHAAKGETDPDKLFVNASVYASHIQFTPIGLQTQLFAPPGDIVPANPDILLAKLRPGQEIDIEMHCVKGVGKDHAKFSPVATASYRLLPLIKIKEPILGEDARFFQKCFPVGVIGLEKDEAGEDKAVVKDARRDTVSREVLRHDRFKGKVELGRVRDHFICTFSLLPLMPRLDRLTDEHVLQSLLNLQVNLTRTSYSSKLSRSSSSSVSVYTESARTSQSLPRQRETQWKSSYTLHRSLRAEKFILFWSSRLHGWNFCCTMFLVSV